jgi:hypothetical protein
MIRILGRVVAGHEEYAPRLMHDKLGGPLSSIGTDQRFCTVLTDGVRERKFPRLLMCSSLHRGTD